MLEASLDDVYARIAAREPEVGAWQYLPDQRPEAIADGPLAGVPIGVKDNFDTYDMPTERGALIYKGRRPDRDAWLVAKLRDLGAVIAGKTVTAEFAYFKPGKTRNPHDPARTPGGSSSGSAAAVGSGMVPAAIGSQTAGSTTRPASFCGCAGLAVSHGTLPGDGLAPLAPSLDTPGLFTLDVADLKRLFTAITGRTAPPRSVDELRLLTLDGTEYATVEAEMLTALDGLRGALTDAGAVLEDLRLSDTQRRLADDQTTVMACEAAEALAFLDDHRSEVSEQILALIDEGRQTSEAHYRAVRERRPAHREEMLATLAGYDAILLPATPGPAPADLTSTGNPILSRPWHLLGMPVVALPGYRTNDGLPLGMQLVGTPGTDETLLETAAAVATVMPH
jgi:Asp-tRNA(Asn)/Glu-tRNA(Gln) amidotransferase A subunit family amidase